MTDKPCTCSPLPDGSGPSYDDPKCPVHSLEVAKAESIEKAKAALLPTDGSTVSLDDIIAILAPAEQSLPVPAKPALPTKITDGQQEAIDKLDEVYGKVVPTEVRKLEVEEVGKLLDERSVLAQIAAMAKTRLDGIRITVLNHSDETLRELLTDEQLAELLTEKEGHFIPKETTSVPGPAGSETEFTVVPVKGSSNFNTAEFEARAKGEEDDRVDWKEYLSCTTQVRVFDGSKAIIAARKNPELLKVFADCTTTSTGSVQVRQPKAKNK